MSSTQAMAGPTFARLQMTVKLKDRKQVTTALISELGAFQVLPQEKYADHTGKFVTVELEGLSLEGRLIREYSGVTSFYNVKFHFSSEGQRQKLKDSLARHKLIQPPWERKYPRFSTRAVQSRGLFVPAHIALKPGHFYTYPVVLNFTLGGILCETQDSDLESARPGQILSFEMQMNDGSLIRELSGRIVRVNEDSIPFDARLFRQIALEMSPESQNNPLYKTLLRNTLKAFTKS